MCSDFRKEEVNQTWTVKDADIVIAKAAQDVLSPSFSRDRSAVMASYVQKY